MTKYTSSRISYNKLKLANEILPTKLSGSYRDFPIPCSFIPLRNTLQGALFYYLIFLRCRKIPELNSAKVEKMLTTQKYKNGPGSWSSIQSWGCMRSFFKNYLVPPTSILLHYQYTWSPSSLC